MSSNLSKVISLKGLMQGCRRLEALSIQNRKDREKGMSVSARIDKAQNRTAWHYINLPF
jgi:hypothetical protein